MKQTIIASLFCLSLGSYAQAQDINATKRQLIHERAKAIYCETNGNMGPRAKMHYKTNYSNVHAAYPDAPVNAVPANPSGDYTALQDPPCYKYKNVNGKMVMECPGAALPRQCDAAGNATTLSQTNGSIEINRQGTYLGYYNSLQSIYPQAPANAVPARPTTSAYTQLQDPPCYKYINKRGLEVTECPGARFEPEHQYR